MNTTTKLLLANALSMRKEFETRIGRVRYVNVTNLTQRIEQRISTGADRSSLDKARQTMTPFEALAEPMYESRRLRLIDEAIQAVNVKTEVEVPKSILGVPLNKESGTEKMTLHRALLLRKEYELRKSNLMDILSNKTFFAEQFTRTPVPSKDGDPKDNAVLVTPRLNYDEVQSAYDWTAMQFRMLNDVISRTNWITEIEVDSTVTMDFSALRAAGQLASVIGQVSTKKEAEAAS